MIDGGRLVVAAGLVGALGAGGCYHYEPMRVEVRAAGTAAPVEGAVVRATPLNADGPASLRSLIGLPPMPAGAEGRTGADGAVDLSLAVEDPVRVLVTAPGFAPMAWMLDRHPAIGGGTDWLTLDAGLSGGDGPRGLEVRFARPDGGPGGRAAAGGAR